jgi:prepilin-type N-terminal cleavage/methylation domain-containing protein
MKAMAASPRTARRRAPGFTLIEIMVVVAVMAVIVVAGVPTLYRLFHKEGFRKTMNDFTDVCKAARSRAILQGVPTQVVFYPREGRCEVQGGAGLGRAGDFGPIEPGRRH